MGRMSRTAVDSQELLGTTCSEKNGKVPGRWRVVSVLPLAMLLIGVSTSFFFDGGRGHFYRRAWSSSETLSIADNFSPVTHFINFHYKYLDEFGNSIYHLYGRFPPGGYALIKLVTFAFDDNISTQIYMARMLMLGFFVGTVVLAYWTLCRLTSSKWVALSATALAFSSGYFLYYNDLISTEFGVDLFGCMLVFHGMVIFTLEGRFRQLVVKSCIALLLGWHVLAVLMPFIALGLLKEVFIGSARHQNRGGKYFLTKIRVGVAAITTSRYMVLGIIVVSFATLVLVSNVGHQFYYRNIEINADTELFDLPVFESATRRLGDEVSHLSQFEIEQTKWPTFLRKQFVGIGLMSIPFALPGYSSAPSWWEGEWRLGVSELQNLFTGISVVGICVIGGFFARYRLLTMTAVLSGFCWSIPWRYSVALHHWEALYYVGLPLVFFTLIFTVIRKQSSELFMGSISAIAVLIFGFSTYQMSSVRDNSIFSAEFHQTMIDDFEAIRRLARDSSVLVPITTDISEIIEVFGSGQVYYYLSGNSIVFNKTWCSADKVDIIPDEIDFIIQTRRDMPGLLTPGNQRVYLYDQYAYEREVAKFVRDNRPFTVIDGLDVYLTDDRWLFYIGDRCEVPTLLLDSRFFLEIVPVLVDDLPEQRRPYGYDRIDFYFDEHNVLDTKRHISAMRLPDYDIASIRIGQFTRDGDLIWESIVLDPEFMLSPSPGESSTREGEVAFVGRAGVVGRGDFAPEAG